LKKLLIMTLAVVLVIGMTGIGYAGFEDSNMEEGLDNSPVFEEGDRDSWEHDKGAPRFDTDNGRIAIDAEEPGLNSDEDSAISEHGDDSIVKTNPDDDF